jgi:hypothetical protein
VGLADAFFQEEGHKAKRESIARPHSPRRTVISELAYNINGEAFDLPATATGWRVPSLRRLVMPKSRCHVYF